MAVHFWAARLGAAMGGLFSWLSGSGARRASNTRLQAELAQQQARLHELEAANADLARQVQERTEDLRVIATRFETAIGGSLVSVSEQDADLQYTWVFNPPAGLLAGQMVGRSERELFGPAAEQLQAVKREALAAGEPRSGEIELTTDFGRTAWSAFTSTPTRLRNGSWGVVTSSTNVTLLKLQQGHLQTVMQELNHRSKNLLTIVQSLARQSVLGLDVPEAFLTRFSERLRALARAHDVLVEQDWRYADLRSVVEGQLQHQIDSLPGRIRLEGEPLELPPQTAHYVGLAVHELGTNAAKYGALSNGEGYVDVRWGVQAEDGAARLHLAWRESGGPRVSDEGRRGFGRTILETLTPRAMGGSSALQFAEGGVSWTLTAPLAASASL